jgi:hypothetical protein
MRHIFRCLSVAAVVGALLCARDASAQIRVNPTGVNVNGQGATTAFLTFGALAGYAAAEAMWCGEIVPATPAIGFRCDPATVYGVLPARYNQSQTSGVDALTDIMALPASVARRAYQAAAAGREASFFYVRRFVKAGKPDQFVAVTCRLTGGGARVPLSLVDVQLAFDVETPILQVEAGQRMPPVSARLVYTGSGRLQGRWEIVMPGQDTPTASDLLTTASLPAEDRGSQRRYPELDRFDVFLPAEGRFTLPGPDPGRLPTGVEGQYTLLLRVEATDDKEADSDLAAVGAGAGVVHSAGVAGFPMPVLRYLVGHGVAGLSPSATAPDGRAPADGTSFDPDTPIDLVWRPVSSAGLYRVEVAIEGKTIHQAFVRPELPIYRLPPFVVEKAVGAALAWRVVAMTAAGKDASAGGWRVINIQKR